MSFGWHYPGLQEQDVFLTSGWLDAGYEKKKKKKETIGLDKKSKKMALAVDFQKGRNEAGLDEWRLVSCRFPFPFEFDYPLLALGGLIHSF